MKINSINNNQNFKGLKDIFLKNIGSIDEGVNSISGVLNNKGSKDLTRYLNLKDEYYKVKDYFDFGKTLRSKRLKDPNLKESFFKIGYFYIKQCGHIAITPFIDGKTFSANSFERMPIPNESREAFFNRVIKERDLRNTFIIDFKDFAKDILTKLRKSQTLMGVIPKDLKEIMKSDIGWIFVDPKFK